VKPALSSRQQSSLWAVFTVLPLAIAAWSLSAAPAPLPCLTNFTVTVMAANLTGQSQRYEEPQIRILQGLRPDIAALQEFRYGESSAVEIRAFVDLAFGPDFSYYRESSATEPYSIPNGIVSRFPIVDSGCWDDAVLPDRGFAWARIRLPGTNDLYVVSVHFKASAGADNSLKRATEASNLLELVQASFPTDAWIVVAGDLNTGSRGDQALATLKTLLSDAPIPTDAMSGGNEKTNLDRDRPYDYVLPSFSLTNRLAPVVVGGRCFSNGLVFDSRVFSPLEAVPPVQLADSTNCQHMAVLKSFRFSALVTNWIEVSSPRLSLTPDGLLQWTSHSNLVFRVQSSGALENTNSWVTIGSTSSGTSDFFFPVSPSNARSQFYRVACP
jgi:endonuclease/exonuclease/phosphatase family metal-dependent hydrolase